MLAFASAACTVVMGAAAVPGFVSEPEGETKTTLPGISARQVAEQPSPEAVLPSSQVSPKAVSTTVLPHGGQAPGGGASFPLNRPMTFLFVSPPKTAQYRFPPFPTLRMIPSFAANGGVRLTSVRRQIAFTTDGFTRTSLQGSPGRPGPRYLKPFAPGGLPSAVQRAAGRPYVLSPAPVAVSKMRRVAPIAVGAESGSGRSKLVTALATNLASAPVFTTAIVPGISSSGSFAARVGTMADTTAPRIRTGTSERAMRPPPPPVTRAAGPGCPQI